MRRKGGHGISVGEGRALGDDSQPAKLTIRGPSASQLPPRGIGPRLDSAPPANTLSQITSRSRGERHAIRHLLRAAIAAPVGSRRRTQALSERANATGNRRPAWLRPCVGGGTSFSGRIFA